jgi:hypothetical protein
MLRRATRSVISAFALAALLFYGTALAQQAPQAPAPPKPYKKISVNLPAPLADPSLEAFRKQLADIARRKDRAALAAAIVPQGFFWEREGGDAADEKKSGIDNFAAATGLDAAEAPAGNFSPITRPSRRRLRPAISRTSSARPPPRPSVRTISSNW